MPENSLLQKLVYIYKYETIRYPRLKAVTLAQWMVESARATSRLATQHYNFAGLKWRPEMRPYATRIRYQAHDGEDYYCQFATLESFVNGYWAFLNRAPYSGWEEHTQTAQEFIGFIGPIYTPNPKYAAKVLRLVPEAQTLLEAADRLPLPPVPPEPIGTIVIDPGHGGTAPVGGSSPNNAISASGVKEKKLTLEFALILADALSKEGAKRGLPVRVVLTRNGDFNLGIAERAKKAAQTRADLFLSLHFNGGGGASQRGTETFYRAAENGNLNLEQDQAFASLVCDSLVAALKKVDAGARSRGVKPDTQSGPGALGVLNDRDLGNTPEDSSCRACLLEVEYIDKPAIDRLLVSGPKALTVRRQIMQALAVSLIGYLEQITA